MRSLQNRRPGSVPDRRSGDRRAGLKNWVTGWWRSPRAIRTGQRYSPKSTAWKGFWGSDHEVLADPEVDAGLQPAGQLTARAVESGGRGGPANQCSPKSRTPAIAPRRSRWPTASQAAGVPVVEAFHYVYHPVTRRLLDLIGSGELGELRARWRSGWTAGARCRRSALVAGNGRRRIDGPGLLRPALDPDGGPDNGGRTRRSSRRVRLNAIQAWTRPVTSRCTSVTPSRTAFTVCSPRTTTSAFRKQVRAEKRWCTTSSSRRMTIA